LSIGVKLLAKVRREQAFFYMNADLGAGDKHCDGNQEQPPRGEEDSAAEKDAEHGGIDGMTDDLVRA
jgi:hypothetical protein